MNPQQLNHQRAETDLTQPLSRRTRRLLSGPDKTRAQLSHRAAGSPSGLEVISEHTGPEISSAQGTNQDILVPNTAIRPAQTPHALRDASRRYAFDQDSLGTLPQTGPSGRQAAAARVRDTRNARDESHQGDFGLGRSLSLAAPAQAGRRVEASRPSDASHGYPFPAAHHQPSGWVSQTDAGQALMLERSASMPTQRPRRPLPIPPGPPGHLFVRPAHDVAPGAFWALIPAQPGVFQPAGMAPVVVPEPQHPKSENVLPPWQRPQAFPQAFVRAPQPERPTQASHPTPSSGIRIANERSISRPVARDEERQTTIQFASSVTVAPSRSSRMRSIAPIDEPTVMMAPAPEPSLSQRLQQKLWSAVPNRLPQTNKRARFEAEAVANWLRDEGFVTFDDETGWRVLQKLGPQSQKLERRGIRQQLPWLTPEQISNIRQLLCERGQHPTDGGADDSLTKDILHRARR